MQSEKPVSCAIAKRLTQDLPPVFREVRRFKTVPIVSIGAVHAVFDHLPDLAA